MANKILGQPGAIEQPRKYKGGPFKVDTTERSWRGPKKDVLAKILEMRRLGYEWQLEENGPNAVLTAQVPNIEGGQPEVPVQTWELLPGAVEKDLLESDVAICELISDDEKQVIRDAIENHQKTPPTLPSGGSLSVYGQTIFSLMLKGVKAVKMFAPQLKHQYTVSNVYAVKFANTNVKRILSTTALITTEALPSSFLLTMNTSPYTDVSSRAGLSYGWYKNPPTLQTAANNRLQVSQDWEFGLWSTVIYGAVVT